MRAKVRQALDTIDEVLAVGDVNSQGLWDLLTALRSRDITALEEENYGEKLAITIPIRQWCFPRTATNLGYRPADFGDPTMIKPDLPTHAQTPSSHFNIHIAQALSAIHQRDVEVEP